MALTAKDIRGTTVRKQLDAYAKAKGFTPKQKGDLTKKFLANLNKNYPNGGVLKGLKVVISGCFIWSTTPEGHDFWNEVDAVYFQEV